MLLEGLLKRSADDDDEEDEEVNEAMEKREATPLLPEVLAAEDEAGGVPGRYASPDPDPKAYMDVARSAISCAYSDVGAAIEGRGTRSDRGQVTVRLASTMQFGCSFPQSPPIGFNRKATSRSDPKPAWRSRGRSLQRHGLPTRLHRIVLRSVALVGLARQSRRPRNVRYSSPLGRCTPL